MIISSFTKPLSFKNNYDSNYSEVCIVEFKPCFDAGNDGVA